MKMFEVIGTVARFPAGFILKLTVEQAAARAHRLRPVETGHAVMEPVEFKRGEIVGVLTGDIGKGFLADVMPAEPAPGEGPFPMPASAEAEAMADSGAIDEPAGADALPMVKLRRGR